MELILLIPIWIILFYIFYKWDKKRTAKKEEGSQKSSTFQFLKDNGSRKTLRKISDNDHQYGTALRNPEYREFLLEKYNEDQIREYFYSKHNIVFSDIYAGEIRVDWDKFKIDLLEYSKKLNNEEILLVIYGMLITVARSDIRRFKSDRSGWNNIWSEQVFNQIKKVITLLYEKLTPIINEDSETIDNKLDEIREKLQEYCSYDDNHWITIFNHIEEPLREIFDLKPYAEKHKG